MDSLAGRCRLDKSHTERATQTLVNAFMEDPLYAALIPDRNPSYPDSSPFQYAIGK